MTSTPSDELKAAEVAARAVYAANGWWRERRADDDGKGRYRDGGTMIFRAVEWDDLDDEERADLIRDAGIAINAALTSSRREVLEEAARVAEYYWSNDAKDIAAAIRALAEEK